jgi:hypothetical protein
LDEIKSEMALADERLGKTPAEPTTKPDAKFMELKMACPEIEIWMAEHL